MRLISHMVCSKAIHSAPSSAQNRDGHRHDVMRPVCLYSSDEQGPWMLCTSRKSLSRTKGTATAFPESGP